jgi:hypothetical protein
MTNRTPHHASPQWGQPPRPGLWSRLTPLQRAGVVLAALVLPCCGGVAVIGALSGEPDRVQQIAPAADRQIAGAAPATEQPAPAEPAATGPSSTGPSSTTEPAATTAEPSPVVEKRTVVERKTVKYATRRVNDSSLDKGRTRVRTKGVAGVRTLTYEVTYTGGAETGRRLVSSEVTRKPVTRVLAVGTRTTSSGGGNCAPGYSPCVPVASDVDCAGGSGDGPAYVRGPVRVTGSDPYDLDRDRDGIACDD